MDLKSAGQALLENAYKLSTPADNVSYYREFATSYDTDFAEQMGWQYPKAIAEVYRRNASGHDVPIVDIGCGTGFVAQELLAPRTSIDGMDISPEMLAIAKGKGLYRALYQVDLSGPLTAYENVYGAVLSAGTFTYGHLGPGPLRNLLNICRPGCLFVIGVNQVHFDKEAFSHVLGEMTSAGLIGPVRSEEVNMYSKPGHAHSNDVALVLQYRKR